MIYYSIYIMNFYLISVFRIIESTYRLYLPIPKEVMGGCFGRRKPVGNFGIDGRMLSGGEKIEGKRFGSHYTKVGRRTTEEGDRSAHKISWNCIQFI
jgi:hypothetical protein